MRSKRQIESLIKATGLVMLVYGVLIFSPVPKDPAGSLGFLARLFTSLKASGWMVGVGLLFALPLAILLEVPEPVLPREVSRWVAAGYVFSGLSIATGDSMSPHDSLVKTLASLVVAIALAYMGIAKWMTEIDDASSKKTVPADPA